MVVRQLQALLAGIYDVPLAQDVAQFLLTDRSALPGALPATNTDEQLLVAEDADGVSIGLVLDPAVLERLAAANPLEALNGGGLPPYWEAARGVGHFGCVGPEWGNERSVGVPGARIAAGITQEGSRLIHSERRRRSACFALDPGVRTLGQVS